MKLLQHLNASFQRRNRRTNATRHRRKILTLETLEVREMFHGESLTSSGILHVEGTAYKDEYNLSIIAGGTLSIRHRAPDHPNVAERSYHHHTPQGFNLQSIASIRFKGGSGDDSFVHDGQPSTTAALPPMDLDGGPGDDRLYGGDKSDTIRGGDGNDKIWGYGGGDVLHGGNGNDQLTGDSGNGSIFGNDFLCGGSGSDTLVGNNGDDHLYGGGGDDARNLIGGNGNNLVTTGACPVLRGPGDIDGDGRADKIVWRNTNGVWYITNSWSGKTTTEQFGLNGDVPVAADYDADGLTDLAVYRPSNATWYVKLHNGQIRTMQWGDNSQGDIPLPGDYNGDGKDDLTVYRPTTQTWWIRDLVTGQVITWGQPFGVAGDIPVPKDYNRDGKTDLGVYRPVNGTWWVMDATTRGWIAYGQQAGTPSPSDIPVPADYTGDGMVDFAAWNPQSGVWKYRDSNTGLHHQVQWGLPGDSPQPTDFDGDGRADFAVYRPGNGSWYVRQSSNNATKVTQWGLSGDWAIYDQTRRARAVIGIPQSLMSVASGSASNVESDRSLVNSLQPLLRRAIAVWTDHSVAASLNELAATIEVRITDLPTGHVGLAHDGVIYVDVNADGNGWFIDTTPADNSEFGVVVGDELRATSGIARSRIDLLTVLAHEVGHILGHDDHASGEHVMNERIATGTRRLSHLDNSAAANLALQVVFGAWASPSQNDFGTAIPTLAEPRNASALFASVPLRHQRDVEPSDATVSNDRHLRRPLGATRVEQRVARLEREMIFADMGSIEPGPSGSHFWWEFDTV